MSIFFTADTHFFHHNIIKYCKRPFSAARMNEELIRRWNNVVGKEDVVYHLGDVSFGGLSETFRVLAELNGKLHLITGNHDDELIQDPYLAKRFVSISPYQELMLEGRRIVLFHYPIQEWREAQRGSWHLYGHTHGAIQLKGAAMDVGIDTHPEYRPYHLSEIITRLQTIAPLPYPKKPKALCL
ncbi:MAG: metallophosphoesterase family protein [Cardiobacteriaceae bacterium]|nr:metallophosphoesterase family protein [Cardiobacteriaceae bacterium]